MFTKSQFISLSRKEKFSSEICPQMYEIHKSFKNYMYNVYHVHLNITYIYTGCFIISVTLFSDV